MSKKVTWADIEAFERKMRVEHRLKKDVDYAIALKYGEAHLMCCWVHFDILAAGGIEFASCHTWKA